MPKLGGEDDRFEEIRRLLDSTISEFQSLFQSAAGFEDSRAGNGWNPDQITLDTYCLEPKSLDELSELAEARKRSLFRHRPFFLRPSQQEVHMLGKTKVELIPFWKAKGFHECFYFRGSSYRIDLQDDVVAVEVEGRIRDLVGQDTSDLTLPNLTRRLLGKREAPGKRSIHMNDVTELAYAYKEGSLFLDMEGREDVEAEAFFEGKVPLRKTTREELAKEFPDAEISNSAISKEDLVRRLHAMIVKPPAAFSKILSSRFQVTELAQFLVPIYSFVFEWHGQQKRLKMHGFTGGLFH